MKIYVSKARILKSQGKPKTRRRVEKTLSMVNSNLVGRCGLYCGACIVYRAYKDSAKLRESIARDYRHSPDEVKCEGCQVLKLDGWDMDPKWGKNCLLVKCLNGRGLDFCCQCDMYQRCKKFRRLAEDCLERGEDLVANLSRIEAGEVEEWLQEEDGKWRCPECGKPIAMHLAECHWCGAKTRPS